MYLRQHSMVRTDRLPPEEREQIRRSKVELARRAFRRGHRASGTFPTQQHVRLLGEPHYGRPLGWKLVAAVLREEKERHAAGDSPTGEEVAPESPPQLADVPPDARRVQVREPDGRVKFKRPSEVAPDDVIMRNAENDVVVMKGRPGRKPSKGADPKKPSTPSLEERVADLEHQLAVMRGRLGAKTQEVSRLEKRLKLAEMREVAEELDAAAEEAEREAEEEGQRAVDEVLSAIGEGDAETGDDATDVMDIINMVTDCEPDPTTQAKRDLFDNRTMLAEGVEGMRRLRHRVSTEGDGPTMAELRQLNDALLKSVEVLRDDRDRLQEELEARNGRGEITLSDLVRMGVGFTVTPGTQEPTDATP